MPLSEHEERILAEIERRLTEDDPRFIERTRRVAAADGARLRWSVAGFVVGLLLLFGLTFHIGFGFVGFALMLVSVIVGVRAVKGLRVQRGDDLFTRFRRGLQREDRES
ncbi:MAG: DUF3040 domain-containing protein [Actinobacteria bacterium]|nr:DUF3040 domain-containing protein [Actinomycetota bacterium]